MTAIIKKEFKTYFLSPIGYVFIGLFLLSFSVFFYLDVFRYSSVNFENIFYSGSTILTFIIPILTMRSFAEEKKNGTDQLIFTSPVSITKVVLSKFIAATCIVLITELFTFMYYIILGFFGNPKIGTALVTMIGFLFLAMTYISFGLLASSVTENQIIAGVVTIGAFILTWFLPQFSKIFNCLSFINMYSSFPSGRVDITSLIAFVTFTMLCLTITIIVIQRRKSVK